MPITNEYKYQKLGIGHLLFFYFTFFIKFNTKWSIVPLVICNLDLYINGTIREILLGTIGTAVILSVAIILLAVLLAILCTTVSFFKAKEVLNEYPPDNDFSYSAWQEKDLIINMTQDKLFALLKDNLIENPIIPTIKIHTFNSSNIELQVQVGKVPKPNNIVDLSIVLSSVDESDVLVKVKVSPVIKWNKDNWGKSYWLVNRILEVIK